MRVKNLNDSFNMGVEGMKFFCVFKNISWVKEYLIHFRIFCKLGKKNFYLFY